MSMVGCVLDRMKAFHSLQLLLCCLEGRFRRKTVATFVDALLWGGPYPEQHFVSVKNDLQVTRYQLQNLQNYQLLDGTM